MQRSGKPILVAALAVLAAVAPTSAYTDNDVVAIFQMLDTNGDGKVTREEFSANKVAIIYRHVQDGRDLTFDDTRLSRSFFDAADVDHDGTLEPVEILDALRFEDVDTDAKGYFTLDDLRRFATRILR